MRYSSDRCAYIAEMDSAGQFTRAVASMGMSTYGLDLAMDSKGIPIIVGNMLRATKFDDTVFKIKWEQSDAFIWKRSLDVK